MKSIVIDIARNTYGEDFINRCSQIGNTVGGVIWVDDISYERIKEACGIKEVTVPNNPPLPSRVQMARNVVQSFGQLMAAGVKAQPLKASPEEQAVRGGFCAVCDWFRPQDGRCAKCGCYMQFKLSLGPMRCPLGYWGPVVPPAGG